MKKFIIVLLLLSIISSLSASSCGRGTTDNSLDSMFYAVPLSMASNAVLWFGNMERIKEQAGLGPDTSWYEYVNEETQPEVYRQRMDFLEGYGTSPFSGIRYLSMWKDAFGFDAFTNNQEIWAESMTISGETHSLFSIMKGNFNKDAIVSKLEGLGYELKEYGQTKYYSIHEDYSFGGRDAPQPFLMTHGLLNRIMVTEREIIAAPSDDIFFKVLDARNNDQQSLQQSSAYNKVAKALGDVLGAAIVPPSQVISENIDTTWGKLHEYDLIGIGYTVENGQAKTTIIVHYPDDSAEDDITELSRRLSEYKMSGQIPLSERFEISEPEAISYGPDSILKIELAFLQDAPRTWIWMIAGRDLGFLVINPAASLLNPGFFSVIKRGG